MKKKIILCADDFGLNQAISKATINLIAAEKISATSCLVNAAAFSNFANILKSFNKQIDLGLHFDLTANSNLFGNLKILIVKAKLHLLKQNQLEEEFNRQLDKFEAVFGVLPDFIDGHQHVHQLPIVCDAILAVYAKRLQNKKPYLRFTHTTKNTIAFFTYCKSLLINFVADKKYAQKLDQASIPYNQTFAGIYNFNEKINYAEIFPKFLSQIQNNGIIMCHPGLQEDTTSDPIANHRYKEYCYFLSSKFQDDCKKAEITIERFQK